MKTLIRNLFILVLNFLYNNAFKLISSLSLVITAFAIYNFLKNILMLGVIDAIAMSIVIILIFIILLVVIILSNITDTIIDFIQKSFKGIKVDKSLKNK